MTPLTFVLYRWRSRQLNQRRVTYTAEHVNTVCAMLRRNLTLPYRVICFTDDPTDIQCETAPIPAPHLLRKGNCWHRLWLFSSEARELGDRLVSLDLDTVITDNIDPLFQDLPPFKIWRGAYEKIAYCGSLWTLEAGAFPQVWEALDPSELVTEINRTVHPACIEAGHVIGSDQAWMALKLPGMPTWTSEDGVLSYHREARGELPPGARIVNFHGHSDPTLESCQKESPWIETFYW